MNLGENPTEDIINDTDKVTLKGTISGTSMIMTVKYI